MEFPITNLGIQPSDLPDKVEFDKIMNGTTYLRDKSLIALMSDGGFRICGIYHNTKIHLIHTSSEQV